MLNPIVAGHMLYSSLKGKIDRAMAVVADLDLPPNAAVLDVGCGHGLMTIAALRNSPTCHVHALDVFNSNDQFDNCAETLESNLIAEFAHHRVTIVRSDARAMTAHLPRGAFDCILSSFAIHNLSARADREQILSESLALLRPGGVMLIMDINFTGQYAEWFQAVPPADANGCSLDVTLSAVIPLFLPMITRTCTVRSIVAPSHPSPSPSATATSPDLDANPGLDPPSDADAGTSPAPAPTTDN